MKFFFLFILFILSVPGSSQEAFTIIKDVPALEGYDLLKDRKGYIWLGHDLGISRYSGQNFISFSNPQQNALSMTDLWEDSEGRIWCHNFEGQIYYVDQFKLKLLEAYRFAEEPSYPRIGICKDELLATSSKGLFVCNTKTLSSKYYFLENGITSLCVLDNKVLLYGKGNWYVYRKGEKLKKITGENFSLSKTEGISLSQTGKNDTAFMISNPEGTYYKLLIENDRLVCPAKKYVNGFINSMTIAADDVWVHTKSKSFKDGGNDTIYNNSISDLVKDNNGNIFYSNLKTGLAVQYANSAKVNLRTGVVGQYDFIRKLLTDDSGFVCGTQKGKLLKLSNELNKRVELSIPGYEAPVEQLFKIAPDEYLAGVAIGIFRVNFKKRKVVPIDNSIILKDIAIDGDSVFLATTTGVLKTSIHKLISADAYKQSKFQYSVIKAGRTRTIARSVYHPYFLCSFSDGVYKIENNSATPLLYNRQRIYATSIRCIGKKIIIGTFNQGLFIIDDKKIRNITSGDGLISNSVKSIKVFDNRAWIIFHGFIQKMNEELNIVPAPDIPFKGSLIYDLVEKRNKILIAVNNGMYEVSADFKTHMADPPTIDFILINGKDTATGRSVFSHSQNNLQINLSTPFFRQYDPLRYKYRFYQETESDWQISDDNQKLFDLVALQPGNYVFEIIPINHAGLAIAKPLMQIIRIKPAWYQTILFKAVVFLAGVLIVFLVMRLYYNLRLQEQKRGYEQMLVIQKERQRISSEMHDDIGASLSSVRLLTEMTKNKLKDTGTANEINNIYQSVGDISAKMQEVIWSLNSENDHLNNLIYFIQKQVRSLFEHYPGKLNVELPAVIPDIELNGEIRRNIYLVVKEAVHNIIKHSGADKIKVTITFKEKLVITVSDNGKGMNSENYIAGNGWKNMQQRMKKLNGVFLVKKEEGLTLIFEIPIKSTL
jgi:signal transduction histidine kinase